MGRGMGEGQREEWDQEVPTAMYEANELREHTVQYWEIASLL